jgi:hypothetical protein
MYSSSSKLDSLPQILVGLEDFFLFGRALDNSYKSDKFLGAIKIGRTND